ncbi:MAG: N-acetylmuramoyl-L-alanine amidase [Oscillospiraceae bacterium]
MTVTEKTYAWAYPLTSRRSTELVILHHAAASGNTAEEINVFHQTRGWAGIAYHYYVRRDGSVYRGRPEWAVGGHTEDHNYNSVGVCFEGNFEQERMGAEQLEAGAELLEELRSRYPGIVVKKHRDFNATACPGRNFPFEEMTEEMTQEKFNIMADSWLRELAKLEPSDWSAEARAWAEKNGLVRGDGNGCRQYKKLMTREEFVTVAYRQAKTDEKN